MERWEFKWFLVSPENDGPGEPTGRESRILKSCYRLVRWGWGQSAHICDGIAQFMSRDWSSGLSPKPGIGLEWPDSIHCVLFVPNLGICCFLRGKSWKFQAPAVTHVSTWPLACPLKSVRPSPGTILWRKLYSGKIILNYWPIARFSSAGNCHLPWMFLDCLLLGSPFRRLWSSFFLFSSELLLLSSYLPFPSQRCGWLISYFSHQSSWKAPLIHDLDRADTQYTPILWVSDSHLPEKEKPPAG